MQYADSSTYMAKFRQLQARAMGAVRSKVQAVLKSAASQVSTLPVLADAVQAWVPQLWVLAQAGCMYTGGEGGVHHHIFRVSTYSCCCRPIPQHPHTGISTLYCTPINRLR